MSRANLQLEQGEKLIEEEGELCYRQITPTLYIDEGQVATHAFGPSPADKGRPSYSRSSLISAQDARDWHSRNANKPSEAVYAVSVHEVITAGTFAIDDSGAPLTAGEVRAPGHCFLDFRNMSKKEERELRAILYRHAMARGEIPTQPLNCDDGLFPVASLSIN
ncbi:hypothetical protein ACH0AG_11075 [Micrococcus luteus]|uniref:Uncharacterized protein n=1 Tax=Micrococcus luteus TaxID=1270 RepID=A0AAP3ALT9_MICLU|nr:hypothetical protein [Micrococcus luteus]